MISNVALYKLIEEMGREGMLAVPDLHGGSCEACHINYKTGCSAAPSVLSVSCGEDTSSTKEVMTREDDRFMDVCRVTFDENASLEFVKIIKARYDGIDDVKMNISDMKLINASDFDTLFAYVTRTKSTPLENFNNIAEVKDYIMSSVDFCFKLTQIISELKLEAAIAVL